VYENDEGGAWVTLSIGGQPRRVYLPPIRPDRDATHIIDLDSGHIVPLEPGQGDRHEGPPRLHPVDGDDQGNED
jgi:hypothetical protein